MAISRNVLAIIASFLLFTSSIANELVERTTNQGFGMLMNEDDADGCPSYTIDCTYTDVCCPIGSYCFGGVFQGICCPTNNDCTSAVTSKPACANSSWGLFDAGDNTPAAIAGQDNYLFCCDEGDIGVDEGPSCWSATDNSIFPTMLASTVAQGKTAPTKAATTTAGGHAATITAGGAATPTKKSLGVKNTGHQLLCCGAAAFVLLVVLL